mmetsp:Transcript_27598/g.89796  ORF Transcript_27598/g.89796 Transcript_27598/m.89796 type:complete len:398 (-) Transcript_27598:19-1212(-)
MFLSTTHRSLSLESPRQRKPRGPGSHRNRARVRRPLSSSVAEVCDPVGGLQHLVRQRDALLLRQPRHDLRALRRRHLCTAAARALVVERVQPLDRHVVARASVAASGPVPAALARARGAHRRVLARERDAQVPPGQVEAVHLVHAPLPVRSEGEVEEAVPRLARRLLAVDVDPLQEAEGGEHAAQLLLGDLRVEVADVELHPALHARAHAQRRARHHPRRLDRRRRRALGRQPVLLCVARLHDDWHLADERAVELERAREGAAVGHLDVPRAETLPRPLVGDQPHVRHLARFRKELEDVKLARLGVELAQHERELVLGGQLLEVLALVVVRVLAPLPLCRPLLCLARRAPVGQELWRRRRPHGGLPRRRRRRRRGHRAAWEFRSCALSGGGAASEFV